MTIISPAGRVRGVSKCRGSGRVGQLRFKISRFGSGRCQVVSKSRGSGRVGSRGFLISRVGSGRVGSTGFEISRVGSRGLEISRVGSDHDPRRYGSLAGRATMTRVLFCADSRVGLRIRLVQTCSCLPEGPCHAGAPRAGHANPTRGSENDTKLAVSCTKVSLVPMFRSYAIIIRSGQNDQTRQ